MSLRAGRQDGREGARGASGPGGRVGAGPFLIDVWEQCQLLQEASRGLTDQRVGTAQSFRCFLKTFLFQPAPTLPTSTVHTEPPHSLPPAWRFRRVFPQAALWLLRNPVGMVPPPGWSLLAAGGAGGIRARSARARWGVVPGSGGCHARVGRACLQVFCAPPPPRMQLRREWSQGPRFLTVTDMNRPRRAGAPRRLPLCPPCPGACVCPHVGLWPPSSPHMPALEEGTFGNGICLFSMEILKCFAFRML